MKINLDDPKTTLRLDPRLKKKAHEIAVSRNMSLNQYIESLIEAANQRDTGAGIRQAIAELQEKTAQLDASLHQLQKRKAK